MAHGEDISEAAALEALKRDAKRNNSRTAPTSRPPHTTNKRFLENLLQDHRSYNARASTSKREQRKSRLSHDSERARHSRSTTATAAFGEAVSRSSKGPGRGRSASPDRRQKRNYSHRERSESPDHGDEHRSKHRKRHRKHDREHDGDEASERKDPHGHGDALDTKKTSKKPKEPSSIKKSSDTKTSSDAKTSRAQHKPKHLEEREKHGYNKKSRRHKTREMRSPTPEPVKDGTPRDGTPRGGTLRDDTPVVEMPGIRWNSKGEGREWDRGKVMRLDADDDGGYDVVQRPAWGKS